MSKPTATSFWLATLKRMWHAFFGIETSDTRATASIKIAWIGAKRVAYKSLDHLMWVVEAAYVITLYKQFDFHPIGLFALVWLYELACAIFFIIVWKKTGEDMTLAESFRHAYEELMRDSKLAGGLIFFGLILKAIFWDGPEYAMIFFQKELGPVHMYPALLVLTATHAAFWTPVYVYGSETVTELFTHLWIALYSL